MPCICPFLSRKARYRTVFRCVDVISAREVRQYPYQQTKRGAYYPYHLELEGERTEASMSQPPQEPPTTSNSAENTASGPTSVQGTPTTEGGDGNYDNEDMQVRRGRLPPLLK